MIGNENVNTEREKANLLCLFKLTLNTLIDQSSSPTALSVLDDKSDDVTNFILTLERVLNFRMRANWLSERRYFWDFVRSASVCTSCQSIFERVEDVTKMRSTKCKGRTWIKFALMEKKLSELLKLVVSNNSLIRKFYHDDSIVTSSQAFVLCDQLTGLNALDFSFCLKPDGPIVTPLLTQGVEIDVIDLTPFLCYKSNLKQILQEQQNDEENRQPVLPLTDVNELKPLNSTERDMVPLKKHKLEVEQRKYFEELLRHRESELQQLKDRIGQLKTERDTEVILMENIVLELQLQLQTVRSDAEFKRKRPPLPSPTKTSPRNLLDFVNRKLNLSATPNNEDNQSGDTQMRSIDFVSVTDTNVSLNENDENANRRTDSNVSDSSSAESSGPTSNSIVPDTSENQYVLTDQLSSNNHQIAADVNAALSPEMLSSATTLSTPTSLSLSSIPSSDEDESKQDSVATVEDPNTPIIQESGRFEIVAIPVKQELVPEEISTNV